MWGPDPPKETTFWDFVKPSVAHNRCATPPGASFGWTVPSNIPEDPLVVHVAQKAREEYDAPGSNPPGRDIRSGAVAA